jgi:prepilin-type N-terminal cleavage/methylation domain-containing protein
MTRTYPSPQAGFSAIELLITLFVAAAFIMAGYQLYTIIIQDGGEARQKTTANNIAYDNLRRYSGQVAAKCVAKTIDLSSSIPADSGLAGSNNSLVVNFTCPYGPSSSVTKVTATLKYGTSTPKQEVTHAAYVTTY